MYTHELQPRGGVNPPTNSPNSETKKALCCTTLPDLNPIQGVISRFDDPDADSVGGMRGHAGSKQLTNPVNQHDSGDISL